MDMNKIQEQLDQFKEVSKMLPQIEKMIGMLGTVDPELIERFNQSSGPGDKVPDATYPNDHIEIGGWEVVKEKQDQVPEVDIQLFNDVVSLVFLKGFCPAGSNSKLTQDKAGLVCEYDGYMYKFTPFSAAGSGYTKCSVTVDSLSLYSNDTVIQSREERLDFGINMLLIFVQENLIKLT